MTNEIKNRSEGRVTRPRRRFLMQAGAFCGAVAAFGTGRVFASAPAAPRRLRFVHTHTGESLATEYFDGTSYVSDALADVNHLLRDFRTGEVHVIDPALLDLLYALQERADHDAPYEIISGYRSPATNAMLRGRSSGVAEHSQHLLGKAIDIRLGGYATRSLGEHARALGRGGVGYYAVSDFVHVDTGSIRFW
jgi:uncharacterized protein YcbK (DUF882 family)